MKSITELLDGPMTDWQSAIEEMDGPDQQRLNDEATALCVRAARLAAYVHHRGAYRAHHIAVSEQNKTAAKVRKVVGYSYAKDDIAF